MLLGLIIENKTTSIGTYFKKLTTGNNMFIISVIVKSSCRILHFCIKCSMCQSCCWTTHSCRIRLVSTILLLLRHQISQGSRGRRGVRAQANASLPASSVQYF